jgi:signal transduction histidine kinase
MDGAGEETVTKAGEFNAPVSFYENPGYDISGDAMTIKRQLFFSNIRMVLVAIVGMAAAFLANRIIMYVIISSQKFQGFTDYTSFGMVGVLFDFTSFAIFVVFFSFINSRLTNRMTKKIIKPLDILSEGVKQIHENNFACRIEYDGDDEFRSVCEAFNHMAAQLEASTERRLKDEANRRELLAGISHDLRTPLTAISGYLDGIESGVASTPQMRENYFHTIKNKTADMKHIIEQLFLFSKLDMDEFLFSFRRFELTRTLSDMVDELEEEYSRRGLDISIIDNSESIFVSVDVSHFRRVLINILENSVKYKERETGHMEISISLVNNFVEVRLADDGPGVNADMLPKLFNVFFRTDSSRHTKGSGLGLAISAKIIERSGGTIHAEPAGSGGLAVVIRLPIETGEV